MAKSTVGLYVHIPFCGKKCPYCDFYSVSYNKATVAAYVKKICEDMEGYRGEGIVSDTLYFGGGTPSLLSEDELLAVISTAKDVFSLDEASEISLEANPNTLNEKRLSSLLSVGINRLSIGVQSFNDEELKALGRLHSSQTAKNAIILADKAGFSNISVDIMLGTPYQTAESLGATLDTVASLPINHVSAYMLTVAEDTVYYESPLLNHCAAPDELADFYLQAISRLEADGFSQYEISNFAKGELKSRHNLKYWKCEEYIGFGASAHSFFAGKRFCHPASVEGYLENGTAQAIVTDEHPGEIDEWLMLNMRLSDGISISKLKESIAATAYEAFLKQCEGFCELKLAEFSTDKKRLYLTKRGFLLSNTIIAKLMEICKTH